jgi:imidazolonepropionase-like amidohydrolase
VGESIAHPHAHPGGMGVTEGRRLLVQGAAAWLGPGRVVDDPAVVIESSRIVFAGPASQAPPADRDVAGDWFLMPGAVDHHVHIGLSSPRAVLHGGVTAVRDLGWAPDAVFPLVDISQGTDFDGPAVAAAGPILTAPGGYPSRAGWCPPGGWVEVEGPEQAASAVDGIAAQDPAVIKVALNADAGPTLADRDLVAICDRAHGRGLPVAAHVQGRGQSERALGAGVDELAHCPWSERLGDDLLSGLAGRVTITSTLDIHSYGRPTPQLETAVDNLRRFAEAGGRIRYGTDLGNGPIPAGIHVGEAFHLGSAGLGPDRILEAMTATRLEPGARADVIALAGNPIEDLRALGQVRMVIRAGTIRRLDRTEDRPSR